MHVGWGLTGGSILTYPFWPSQHPYKRHASFRHQWRRTVFHQFERKMKNVACRRARSTPHDPTMPPSARPRGTRTLYIPTPIHQVGY